VDTLKTRKVIKAVSVLGEIADEIGQKVEKVQGGGVRRAKPEQAEAQGVRPVAGEEKAMKKKQEISAPGRDGGGTRLTLCVENGDKNEVLGGGDATGQRSYRYEKREGRGVI